MRILGISAFYHDSAAALIDSGQIVAAAQEERFSRKKHDKRFPINSIEFVLDYAGLNIGDIDAIVYFENPRLKFKRLLSSYMAYAPKGKQSFIDAMNEWSGGKLFVEKIIRKKLGYKGKITNVLHHESHAASAFFASPFESAAFITADGVGEWQTTSFGTGKKNNLEVLGSIDFPHSLGLLYSAVTQFLGFKVNSGEYKVMGLAPYGNPKYSDLILRELIDLKDDGSFKLNIEYFDFIVGDGMINTKWETLFGRSRREPESLLTQDDMDLAASIQDVIDISMLKLARHVKKVTGEKNLCMAGGVALNCVANGKIEKEGLFENIWIQPAAGDSGGAIGSALFYWYQTLGNSREIDPLTDSMNGAYLGPEYSSQEIKAFLNGFEIPYDYVENPMEIAAKFLSDGKVVGWFQGRMEFGPRALGSRSILGDPRSPQMQKNMNLKIKFRESFRPFAPSILEERISEWFELKSLSPYMLIVADVLEKHRIKTDPDGENLFGIDKLNLTRSSIPAVTHVDHSSRIQTVSRKTNPKFWSLLNEFNKITSVPILVNTSFNVRGEPIVCTPEDAYNCFLKTKIDYLFIENYMIKNSSSLPRPAIYNEENILELD
jgi:carbamoyltransferase